MGFAYDWLKINPFFMQFCYDEISNMDPNSVLNNYKYKVFIQNECSLVTVKGIFVHFKNVCLKHKVRFGFQVKIDFNSFVELFSNSLE